MCWRWWCYDVGDEDILDGTKVLSGVREVNGKEITIIDLIGLREYGTLG